MKSVLLYANDDPGLEARLKAALDIVRFFNGHLICLHATPYHAFLMGDPFGGIYALPVVVEQLAKTEKAQRTRIEERLSREAVSWEWLQLDGPPEQVISDRSRLADLVVLSLPAGRGDLHDSRADMAAEIAVHARGPVLALPVAVKPFEVVGPAVIAWNGSPEAAHSLRLGLPLLRSASAIHIVTVREEQSRFPAIDASRYLARHGITSEIVEISDDPRGAGEALLGAAGALAASYILMGAYGHNRLREAMLGGVTRHMLEHSSIPLLLAH